MAGWDAFGGPPGGAADGAEPSGNPRSNAVSVHEIWDPANFGLIPVNQGASTPSHDDESKWDPAKFGLKPVTAATDAADWSAFGGAPGSDAAKQFPPARLQPPESGFAANVAAGAVEGAAGGLNVLSDPFGNLIGKPLAALGVTAHDALAPVFGYDKFAPETRAYLLSDDVPQIGTRIANATAGAMGAPQPDDVHSSTTGQEMARIGAAGAVGMLGLGSVVRAAPTIAGLAGDALVGAGGAMGGGVAQQVASETYKPAASVLGNLLVGGALGAGAGVAVGAKNSLLDFAAPAIGKRNALLDGATPILDGRGAPVAATPNQALMAGQRIEAAASDPAQVRNSLTTLLPGGPTREIAPGAQPTTAQATADPGLMQLERGVSRGADAAADFRARADAQNDARVAAVRGIADGADPAAVPAAVQRLATNADVQAGQVVGGLQQRAGQAVTAMGGDLPPGSEGTIGQMLRQPLADSLAATRARESSLWNAIDPDGTLAVDMSPITARANEIAQQISPNAAPLAGEEAGIMQTAQNLPNVQSFQDLAALRGRLTDAIRAARSDPNQAQAVRRMSQLLDGVHDTMEGSVNSRAASDAAAVQAGAMAPEAAIMARYQAVADQWRAERNSQSATGTTGMGTASGGQPPNGTGASALPGSSRTASQAVRGSPSSAGYSGGPVSANPLTPNFDAAAASRYADARQATADRVATYRSAPGVGQVLQQGPISGSFKTPDSAVPGVIVKTGPQGADVVRAYQAAGGSPQALSDAAAFSLRQAAQRPDGTIDPAKYQSWAIQRSSFLSALPPEAAARFRTAADAQTAVDTAVTQRADAARLVQDSALGRFLGTADPVTQVASILRSPTATADMGALVRAVGNDPQAAAGLQRAVAEHVLRDMKGNQAGATSAETYLKADQLQTFLKKSEPALRQVLTPEQMNSLQSVADSIRQSNLSTAGSKLGAGSDTAQNAAAMVAGKGSNLLTRVGHELAGAAMGGSTGAAIGSFLGGPFGATMGLTIGGAMGRAVQAAREAGVQNVDHLVIQAMLNPQLARVLLTKVTPQNEASVMAALTSQLKRLSLVATVAAASGGPSQAERPAPRMRVNTLTGLTVPTIDTRRNSLLSGR